MGMGEYALSKGGVIHITSEHNGTQAHSICGRLIGSETKKISRDLAMLEYWGGIKCRRCFSR